MQLTKMPLITSIKFVNSESDKKKYNCEYSGLIYIAQNEDKPEVTDPVWFMCVKDKYSDKLRAFSHINNDSNSDTSILNKFIEEYCSLKPNCSVSFERVVEKIVESLTSAEIENYKRLCEVILRRTELCT